MMRCAAGSSAGRRGFSIAMVLVFLAVQLLALAQFADPSHAIAKKTRRKENPKSVLKVASFKWGQAGMGIPAILREIKIENTGKRSYRSLRIEAEFYTRTDVPQGSLRTVIEDVIAPGETKTYKNLRFGIMNSPLGKSVVRVVGADVVETSEEAEIDPGRMVVVKDWEWTGARYTTEGILKHITLDNTSNENLKNIEIQVEYRNGRVTKGYTRAIIHGVLPSKTTKTFEGINVGFRHPDANKAVISVIGAQPAVIKKKVRRVARKRILLGEGGEVLAEEENGEQTKTSERRRRILAKRYKAQIEAVLEEHRKESETPSGVKARAAKETSTSLRRKRLESKGEALGSQDETAQSESGGKKGIASAPSPPRSAQSQEKGAIASVPSRENAIGYIDIEEEVVEEESVPDQDIVVKGFVMGSSIPSSIGYIKELTLENVSTITYRKIELMVDIYSRTDNRPLSSSKVVIPDILPPKTEKRFQNVKIGFLNLAPENVVIRVVSAKVVNIGEGRPQGRTAQAAPVPRVKSGGEVGLTRPSTPSGGAPASTAGLTHEAVLKEGTIKEDKGLSSESSKRISPSAAEPEPREARPSPLALTYEEALNKGVLEEERTLAIAPSREEGFTGGRPMADRHIIVRDFVVANTVPNSVGYLKELTLQNVSTLTYKKIELVVDVYSRTYSRPDNRPLFSSRIIIAGTLPPKTERKFRNVRIGFLKLAPEIVVLRVVSASVLKK